MQANESSGLRSNKFEPDKLSNELSFSTCIFNDGFETNAIVEYNRKMALFHHLTAQNGLYSK